MRALKPYLGFLALSALVAPPVAAQWSASGVPVCPAPWRTGATVMVGDGHGGAFVAWLDARDTSATRSIYAQHVLDYGAPDPAWPALGTPACTLPGSRLQIHIASDGLGGFFLAWDDKRFGNSLVFLQRVISGGTLAPGWPANGVQVSTHPLAGDVTVFDVVPDGIGGAYLAWRSNDQHHYAQHIDAGGAVVSGWPAAGMQLTIGSGTATVMVEPAPSGGCYVLTANLNSAVVTKLTSAGDVDVGWPLEGRSVLDELGSGIQINGPSYLTTGSNGDLYLAVFGYPSEGQQTLVQRASPEAVPAWGANGAKAGLSYPYMEQLLLLPEGAGGAFMSYQEGIWGDTYATSWNVRINRLDATGGPAPGWSGAIYASDTSAAEYGPAGLVSDGADGVYLSWLTVRTDWPHPRLFVQHLDGAGQRFPGWPATGIHVCDSDSGQNVSGNPYEYFPTLASDGRGGVLVAWDDYRYYPSPIFSAFITRLLGNGQPAVGVGPDPARTVAALAVHPNPSSGDLRLALELPREGRTWLDVLDATGRRVALRGLGDLPAGRRDIEWRMPAALPAGLYWVRARWPGGTVARRIALVH